MTPPTTRSDLRKAPIQLLTAPVQRFLHIEAASGVVLFVCAVVALILANSPMNQAVHDFWEIEFGPKLGGWQFVKPLHFWVNDGLMAIFFFVVGLEIKREIVAGELQSIRKAALPVIAALGGMLAPAGIYLLFGHTPSGQRGWAVPMATDIAFVVGVMALFGKRVPLGLKIFLLTLAIADDIGAIAVIAAVYSEALNFGALSFAVGGFGLMAVLNWSGVRSHVVYLIVGIAVWYAVYRAGIHPTIAGVAIGLLTPYRAWLGKRTLVLALDDVAGRLQEHPEEVELQPSDVSILRFAAREAVAPLQRIQDRLHPWVGFAIMPLFALANAGVEVNPETFGQNVSLAVAFGLLIGKPLGIGLFSFLAVKLKWGALPEGVTWPMVIAGGFLGGIGFTMALFVGELAFNGKPELIQAKAGILLGSFGAALVGAGLLALSVRKRALRIHN